MDQEAIMKSPHSNRTSSVRAAFWLALTVVCVITNKISMATVVRSDKMLRGYSIKSQDNLQTRRLEEDELTLAPTSSASSSTSSFASSSSSTENTKISVDGSNDEPSLAPTSSAYPSPTLKDDGVSTEAPTEVPTESTPTQSPTEAPMEAPAPTDTPTQALTEAPTESPAPTGTPTQVPTEGPTESLAPTEIPSHAPSTPPTPEILGVSSLTFIVDNMIRPNNIGGFGV